jgi:hypothetical protein
MILARQSHVVDATAARELAESIENASFRCEALIETSNDEIEILTLATSAVGDDREFSIRLAALRRLTALGLMSSATRFGHELAAERATLREVWQRASLAAAMYPLDPSTTDTVIRELADEGEPMAIFPLMDVLERSNDLERMSQLRVQFEMFAELIGLDLIFVMRRNGDSDGALQISQSLTDPEAKARAGWLIRLGEHADCAQLAAESVERDDDDGWRVLMLIPHRRDCNDEIASAVLSLPPEDRSFPMRRLLVQAPEVLGRIPHQVVMDAIAATGAARDYWQAQSDALDWLNVLLRAGACGLHMLPNQLLLLAETD